MSEQAPRRPNPRLDNFEANKASHEQATFEMSVYGGEAGVSDFSAEANARLSDGFVYETHMEQLATEKRSDYDRGLARLEDGEISGAYDVELDDAYTENEAFDDNKVSAEQALVDKIADSPALRRMQNMAHEIARIRNTHISETTADSLVRSMQDKEDKLNELLVAYSETSHADEAIIDRIIESTIQPEDTVVSTDSLEAPVAAEGSDVQAAGEAEPKIDTSWANEVEVAPVEAENDIDTSWANEKPANQGTVAAGEAEPDIDTSWANEVVADPIESEPEIDTSWANKEKKFSWLRHPFARANAVYVDFMNRDKPSDLHEKKGSKKMTAVALGAVALVGAMTAYKLGAFDNLFGGHSGGGAISPNTPSSSGVTPDAITPPTHAPDAIPVHPAEFSDVARSVHTGEGWNETFKDMGIPEQEWNSLLQKAGPKLAENNWAYKMADGSWGISRPGTLPQDMLELINNNR